MGKASAAPRPVMSTADWLAANLAAAPPLIPEQVSILSTIFQPVRPTKQAALRARLSLPVS